MSKNAASGYSRKDTIVSKTTGISASDTTHAGMGRKSDILICGRTDASTKNEKGETELIVPHRHDVLFGCTDGITSHQGSRHFREWTRERRCAYNLTSSRKEKAGLTREIIALVQNVDPPGRFPHLIDGPPSNTVRWVQADREKVLMRTNQGLRVNAHNMGLAHARHSLDGEEYEKLKEKNDRSVDDDITKGNDRVSKTEDKKLSADSLMNESRAREVTLPLEQRKTDSSFCRSRATNNDKILEAGKKKNGIMHRRARPSSDSAEEICCDFAGTNKESSDITAFLENREMHSTNQFQQPSYTRIKKRGSYDNEHIREGKRCRPDQIHTNVDHVLLPNMQGKITVTCSDKRAVQLAGATSSRMSMSSPKISAYDVTSESEYHNRRNNDKKSTGIAHDQQALSLPRFRLLPPLHFCPTQSTVYRSSSPSMTFACSIPSLQARERPQRTVTRDVPSGCIHSFASSSSFSSTAKFHQHANIDHLSLSGYDDQILPSSSPACASSSASNHPRDLSMNESPLPPAAAAAAALGGAEKDIDFLRNYCAATYDAAAAAVRKAAPPSDPFRLARENDVREWIESALPQASIEDVTLYAMKLVDNGFDCPFLLDTELLEEDIAFMRKAHRRILVRTKLCPPGAKSAEEKEGFGPRRR